MVTRQKLDEVCEEIQNLSGEERVILREWLDWPTNDESAELLDAIDERIRSAENQPTAAKGNKRCKQEKPKSEFP